MPFVSQALRYSMPPQVRGSITCASVSNTAPTTLDLYTMNNLGAPLTLAVTPTGTTGATTYGYQIVALGPGGKEGIGCAEVTTGTGNATLSTTNYNLITWMEVEGAEGYHVYRSTGAGSYTAGLIGRVTLSEVHTTAGYMAFRDTGITRLNAATAPITDSSAALNKNPPHYIYIENTGSNPLLVTFVDAPNSTVADDKAELILEATVSDTVFTRRFSIAALGNRMFSASHGMRWVSLEGSGGATSAYLELA